MVDTKKPTAGVLRARDRKYAQEGRGASTPIKANMPRGNTLKSAPKKGLSLKKAGKIGAALVIASAAKNLYDSNKTKRK
jgi:hypothetical protein